MQNKLFLMFPTLNEKELWQNFKNEFIAKGEQIIPGIARSGDGTYGTFLKIVTNYHHGIDIAPQFVKSSTYFLMNERQDKILGIVSIRHELNDNLMKVGGHIGYGVIPSERLKGYATKMLSMALEKCKELGIKKALITCDKTNIGSAKTILNNGGVFDNEIIEENGNIVQRYWIEIANT